jgi:Ca-activated chloride channel family protein
MRQLLAACLILLSSLPWCVARAATQESQPGRTVFSSRADLVVLHVSVADRRSGLVAGLPRESFTVYEDGRPQAISFFSNEDSPATVGLVIDSSMSMQRKREALIAAGMTFAGSTHPQDEIFTVHFNERVWFGLGPDRPFTSNRDELRAALSTSTARGRTALFDAVLAALKQVDRGTSDKKALVVISDGGDNSSRASFADVMAAAGASEAAIYTVCLTEEYDGDADPEKLEKLAKTSGAIPFSPRSVGDVAKILERIARDIHSGYTIGFVPSGTAAGRRAIKVEVSAPNRGRMTVRTRSEYGAN